MQFSIGVEYAFHSLFYLVGLPSKRVIGIKALAQLHDVSESYLSKIFTKLRKAGIVRSVPGVKGGYELIRSADEITFWDIIEAIEGHSHLFQCAEIRRTNLFQCAQVGQKQSGETFGNGPCLIKTVILDAEEQMRDYLRGKTLGWLYREVFPTFPQDKKDAFARWIEENKNEA